MQLDQLIIETRVRSGWSAIDLGLVLARSFWLRSVCLYLLLALPVYGLTRLVSADWYFLPYIVLWWMKPLFERPILFLLSRELFAESMSFWQVLCNTSLWLKPGLFWILTLRRFSFSRSMYAPIILLERPDSKAYSKRASILGGKFSSEAFWLTVVLFHLESFMMIAVLAVAKLIAPEAIDVSGLMFNGTQNNNAYTDLISVAVIAGIAPFYVASGFMLYISRRVEIEGWDIEICFRDWMAKHKDHLPETEQTRMKSKA